MIVIDTNILAYLLIDSDRTAEARALLNKDSDWHSEEFILAEFANVLATYVRTGFLHISQALDILADAETVLGPNLHAIDNETVLSTAIEFNITAYDARFIAVAKGLGLTLITEDRKLAASAPEFTLSIAEALGKTPES